MNTRTGKIARLPKSIRNALNERLSDGEQGKTLVAWLNDLPIVQSIMAEDFQGRPINEQNLTEWKQGGYLDWLRQQEALELASQMHEDVSELTLASGDIPLSDAVSTMLTIGLARLLRDAMSKPIDTAEGRKEFLALARELTRIRRVDQRAALVKIEQDKRAEWVRNRAEARAKEQQQAATASAARQPTHQERLDRVTAGLQLLQQLSNAQRPAPSTNPAASTQNRAPGIQSPVPSVQNQASVVENRAPGIQSPPSSIQHLAPSIQTPASINQTESNQIKLPTPSLVPTTPAQSSPAACGCPM